ncbi:MAG TPA: MBL fold metallo-hydrolase [Candidatus Binatia bacterium]|nr:MBL fold metallo-hydrolase [Candidatus Binatia bacterium]
MDTTVTEIAPDVFRLSTFHPAYGIQFNQFLVRDEEPFLMHTGLARSFDVTRAAVARVIDPSTLRWIGYSHFEPDECGALNAWLELAPQAAPVCNMVGAMVMLSDFAAREPRTLMDNEVFATGGHRIRFLSTPHLPHGWDAGMFFDETSSTLFCSDLFFQPGDPAPLVEAGIVELAEAVIVGGKAGPLANDVPYTPNTAAHMQRLADLSPQALAVMHGASFRGDGRAAILGLAAILERELGWPA